MSTVATKHCRYCADAIYVSYLPGHERKCRTQTPEERERAKRNRTYARQAWRKAHHVRVPRLIATQRRNGRAARHSPWANGTGKRLSATISIDFKSFRTLLLQLAPSLSIDRVEVI